MTNAIQMNGAEIFGGGQLKSVTSIFFYDRSALVDDSRVLNILLAGREEQPDRRNMWTVSLYEMEIAWESVGVEIEQGNLFGGHHYYLNGEEISQAQAWKHAEQIVGKHLEPKDLDW